MAALSVLAHAGCSRIDRSILRQTVNIADELDQSASNGDLRMRRRFGGTPMLTLRFVEWQKSSAVRRRILPRGFSSAGRFFTFFSGVLYIFSPHAGKVRAPIVSRLTSEGNVWLALAVPRI